MLWVQKTKYRAWFFIKEHGTFKLKKKKRFNPLSKIIKYKGKPFEPTLHLPSFSNGTKNYYFFEIGSKNQISYTEIIDTDADLKDLMYAKEVIVQVFKSLGEKSTNINWIHLLFVGIATILSGWILGSYIPIGVLP